MLRLLPLLLALALCSCKVLRTSTDTHVAEHTERSTEVVPRDTVIQVPGKEATVTVPLPSIGKELEPRTVRNGPAFITLSSQGGQVTATGGCDTLALAVRLWDRFTKEVKAKETVKTVSKTVEVKVVPWYAWALMGASGLVLLIAMLFIALAMIRKRFTFKL